MSSIISTTQTVQLTYKGQTQIIDVSNIPIISSSIRSIFEELGTKTFPSLEYPFSKKANILANAIEKLTNAKSNAKNDRIAALTKALLYTAIVTVGVWSICSDLSLPVNISIAAFSALACYSLTLYKITNGCKNKHGDPTAIGGIGILAMPVMPIYFIYEAMTKVSRLEKSIARRRLEIEKNFSIVADFFQQDHSQLQASLRQKIQASNFALGELRKATLEAGRQEITQKRIDYEMALKVIEQGVANLRHSK